jgi:hypothetical protein
MEVIDIGADSLEPISINLNDSKPSVNFGSGIELLMNDKKKMTSVNLDADLGNLDSLEAELNELSGVGGNSNTKTVNSSIGNMASNFFGNLGFNSGNEDSKHVKFDTHEDRNDSKLGAATIDTHDTAKTWDGFLKTNEVPTVSSSSAKLSDREKRRKKRAMIKKLEEWKEKGLIKNMSHFTLDSNYEEVEDEYETALEDKRKKDSVKLQGWWFMTFVNSVEYANAFFNPFDLNLDGWGEQVSEDIDSYEEIFSELHEKYKGGKLSPELSLLLRLGFSAAMVNFTNKALSTATPGFNDVIRQSPELMKLFSSATVETMKKQSPSFSFAENILNPNMGPPPTPVKTRDEPIPHPNTRPGMQFTQAPGNRPDLYASRGGPEPYVNANANAPQANQTPMTTRPEMQGPRTADLDNILSGLKTKTVNIHEQPQTVPSNGNNIQMREDDSLISISSLRDMQNAKMPRRTNKRGGSAKNTISLDI